MAKLKLNKWRMFKELARRIMELDNPLYFKIRILLRLPFMVARMKPVITFKKKENSK